LERIMNSDPVARWEEILRSRYWDELLALAGSDTNKSIYVKFSDLERCDPEFASELLERPEKMLGAARAALLQIDLPKDAQLDRGQVRITELPGRFRIGQLNGAHIDKLIAIEGRVVKAGKARSKRVSSAVFLCLRCGNVFLQDLTRVDRADPEVRCSNHECGRRGPFRPLINNRGYVTAQKIRLQEFLEDIKEGVPPRELDVELEDDLVGRAFPGDRVIVNGVLKFYPRKSQASKSTDFDLFFKSISVENMGAGV
jgi:replicative DNA helicase Mcm